MSSPLSKAQRKVLLRYLVTPFINKYRHILRASYSSVLADPALGSKPATLKQGYQDIYIEISNDTYYSINTDNNYNTYNTNNKNL
jgi:hypothetical protein